MVAFMVDELTDVDVELFGSLIAFTQQVTALVDERLDGFGLTSRQWLLLGLLEKAFPGSAPTLSEATAVFGTSRQNVKQIALQLERSGWLRMDPDPVDGRVRRLVLTDKLAVFHDPVVQADQAAFILDVFGGLTPRQRRTFLTLVATCMSHLAENLADATTSDEVLP
jgi:DNA-binding MarR family transcriptional regulator